MEIALIVELEKTKAENNSTMQVLNGEISRQKQLNNELEKNLNDAKTVRDYTMILLFKQKLTNFARI